MDLVKAMAVSASGMRAQGARLRVVSENLANADSTARVPGGEPYRRKTIGFRTEFDRAVGAETVQVASIDRDPSDFIRSYDPGHPAADAEGYVLTPNVTTMVEMMDMRESQRSYEANMNVMTSARSMLMKTIELLRT